MTDVDLQKYNMDDLQIMNLLEFRKNIRNKFCLKLPIRCNIYRIEYCFLNVFKDDKKDHYISSFYEKYDSEELLIKFGKLDLHLEKDGINSIIKQYRRELIINSLIYTS
jgi:hypothetical protein